MSDLPRTPDTSPTPLAAALARRPVVLDGGLATTLEAGGHDLSSALWSARLLVEDPEAIVEVHRQFFAAGAEIATTASYQASYDGFAALGLAREDTDRLLRRSVALAVRARDEAVDERPRWVAASVGPYGAALADGSEYRGDYGRSVTELRRWHRRRLSVLADSPADLLACETVPCLAEVEALLAEVQTLGVPCWLSLTAVGDRTRAGEPLAEAYEMAAGVAEVIALGVNCVDPALVREQVRLAATVGGKPVVVYPNSGETWDARARRWTGRRTVADVDPAAWVEAGARLVGGCCRVGPEQIADLARQLRPYS
ncbi:MAG: homocysteine S-methyltransferase [Actinomycetes bacterium]